MEHLQALMPIIQNLLPALVRTLMGLLTQKGGVTPEEQAIIDLVNKLLEVLERVP